MSNEQAALWHDVLTAIDKASEAAESLLDASEPGSKLAETVEWAESELRRIRKVVERPYSATGSEVQP